MSGHGSVCVWFDRFVPAGSRRLAGIASNWSLFGLLNNDFCLFRKENNEFVYLRWKESTGMETVAELVATISSFFVLFSFGTDNWNDLFNAAGCAYVYLRMYLHTHLRPGCVKFHTYLYH